MGISPLEFKTCYFDASIVFPLKAPQRLINLVILQTKFNTESFQLFDVPRGLNQTEIDNLNIVSHTLNALQEPQGIGVVVAIGKQNGILVTGRHNIIGIIIRHKNRPCDRVRDNFSPEYLWAPKA